MKAILIAGTSSGTGKTTVAAGLMAALRRRRLRVQPFKVGPDYIDPGFHTWATGEPSRNLDTWMVPHDSVTELFTRVVADKDIAVIEGVMGLYDGRSATTDEGSTAEVARLLGAPVLLVADCRKTARSIAATVLGFKTLDPAIKLAGVILNGIGSEGHLKLCSEAIEHYAQTGVLGYLTRSPDLAIPERHLGLVPTAEANPGQDLLDKLVAHVEASFAIEQILDAAQMPEVPHPSNRLFPPVPVAPVVRIAVAQDRAFSFYYQDNLDMLQSWGAELLPFSPLSDAGLPGGVSGIYIGGGFPEMHASELAANQPMQESIRNAAETGMPVYAECGGLMYLGRSIHDLDRVEHRMVGAIPVATQIGSPRLSLGYRTVRALNDGPLLTKGEQVRGHEFHWSTLEPGHPEMNAYLVEEGNRFEGFHLGNIFATYVHLHFAARPGMAQRFIQVCRGFRRR